MKDWTVYEQAQLANEEIETPKDLPPIQGGNFRVIFHTTNQQVRVAFRDIPVDSKVKVTQEIEFIEDGRVYRKPEVKYIDALKFWTYKANKPDAGIEAIIEGPGKRGRPPVHKAGKGKAVKPAKAEEAKAEEVKTDDTVRE